MTYTVHFQKGRNIGARSLRFIRVDATTEREAISLAKRQNAELLATGYRVVSIDTLDNYVVRS